MDGIHNFCGYNAAVNGPIAEVDGWNYYVEVQLREGTLHTRYKILR